mmetsp:Transcript_18262/g.39309  ORF Transcript_18262/g.39309 Transcript_18262/m.39309 type:complete len:206 (+) Transcript_18262:925-1542(+)
MYALLPDVPPEGLPGSWSPEPTAACARSAPLAAAPPTAVRAAPVSGPASSAPAACSPLPASRLSEAGGGSSSGMPSCRIVSSWCNALCTSYSLTLPSSEDDASQEPPSWGDITTPVMGPMWPLSSSSICPFLVAKSLTIPSSQPLASMLPSGEKLRQYTLPTPSSSFLLSQVRTSYSRTASEAVASKAPLGCQATLLTASTCCSF